MMASVAGRYASALFDLALEGRTLAEVEGDVDRLQRMLDDSEDLRRLVRSPVFSADEQMRAVSAVAGQSGMSALTTSFIGLLARNRRLFALQDVLKAFRQIVARHRGEVTAEVTSAHALSEAQLAQLTDTLSTSAGGRRVRVATRIDPAILGGLVVKMGSRMIDSSIRTKLDNLKMRMKEAR